MISCGLAGSGLDTSGLSSLLIPVLILTINNDAGTLVRGHPMHDLPSSPGAVSASLEQHETECAHCDVRCACGSLLARRVGSNVELKCRRCKRTVLIPLED